MKKLKLLLVLLVGILMFVSCEKDDILKPPPTVVVPVPEYATIRLVFSDLPQSSDQFKVYDCSLIDLAGDVVLEDFSEEIADAYPVFNWNMDTTAVRKYKGKELTIYFHGSITRGDDLVGGISKMFDFTLAVKPDVNEIYIQLTPETKSIRIVDDD